MTRRGPVVVRARRRATACLDLKRQAPLLGSLQLVHATRQISYLFIQCHHSCTRKDAFQRHQERAEPTHDSETADCRSRSNKKHQRGKGKQAGGQCQSSVARQCCDQDWKQEKGEWGNAETLQKLAQVFDMLSHYTIPTARRGRTFNSRMDDTGKCLPGAAFFKFTHGKRLWLTLAYATGAIVQGFQGHIFSKTNQSRW